MNCPSCNNETSGIKINGSLFCSNCGEKIEGQEAPAIAQQKAVLEEIQPPEEAKKPVPVKVPINSEPDAAITYAEETTPEWKPTEPESGKIPESEATEEDIETLKAELLAIEMIEKEAEEEVKEAKNEARKKEEIEIKNKEIKKHNRTRADHRHTELKVTKSNITSEEETSEKIEDKAVEQKEELKEKTPNLPEAELKYPLLEKDKAREIKEKAKKKQEVLSKFLKQGTSQVTKTKKKAEK